MSPAVDTHAHLNDPRLLSQLCTVLARARAAAVDDIIVVGWDVPSSELAVRLAQEHPGLWASVGIHPHHTEEGATPGAFQHLRGLARDPRVVAIGETGLDYYRDLSPRQSQLDSLHRHLEIAGEVGIPVVCHCREAGEALLEALTSYPRVARVWHCFDGDTGQAERALAAGLWLGFGGMVTYPRADQLRAAAAATPLGRVLLETDAPYLSPHPERGKRARDNEPANLPIIARCLSELRGVSGDALLAATAATARRLFALGEDRGTRAGSERGVADQR